MYFSCVSIPQFFFEWDTEETFRGAYPLDALRSRIVQPRSAAMLFTDVHRLVLSAFRQVSAVFLRMLSADAAIFPISQWHPAMVLMHLRMDVYTMRQRRLLLVPEGKTSLAIAAGTTTIGTGALQDCTGISTVSLK